MDESAAPSLLVTGATLRANGDSLGEGRHYGSARLLQLDTARGAWERRLEVNEGGPNTPAENPNLQFTASCTEPGTLWLAMDTEIRRYSWPGLALQAVFSHRCFQNIHSVAVRGDELWVTSTGLDLVAVLDKASGAIREVLHAEGGDPWRRFARDVDWRQVHSTRPHHSHPNYVYWMGDEPWVLRCTQEDTVPLRRPGTRPVDVSRAKRVIAVHDGVHHAGRVWFTVVDGSLVGIDPADPWAPPVDIELSGLEGFGGLRGWCRGLCFVGDIAYIGFSRLRRTNNQAKVDWVRRAMGRDAPITEASVLAVDLRDPRDVRIVNDYRFAPGSIDAIYGIMPAPEPA
jgi:hypothetical protein